MTRTVEPLVSILVPAYNAEATLAETLRSALASRHSNLEVVLVDDGSTDATATIAETVAGDDQRVRVFRQTHRGVSIALNFGLSQVRGDLVARLDADDLWHATKLGKQVALLTADPAAALVYTFVRYVDGSGRIVRDAAPQQITGPALCQCLYNGIIGGGSSAVFRRSILDSVGGYDESLAVWEDLMFHLKVAAAGSIAAVPEYLTAYRLRLESSSADLKRSLESWRLARRRIRAEFSEVPAFVHRWSDARRLLELAEGFAFEKDYVVSARLFAASIARDPVRTAAFLGYRLNRRLSGNRRPLRRAGPLFTDACVTTDYSLSEFDAGLEGAWLRALDASRERLLRSIDRKIAETGSFKRLPRSTGGEGTNRPAESAP
jgi:glycosyltransferase involved in cell wall biosynthesis